MYSTGRGGAGNIRSPSGGERVAAPNPHELDVVREYEAKESAEIVRTPYPYLALSLISPSSTPLGAED